MIFLHLKLNHLQSSKKILFDNKLAPKPTATKKTLFDEDAPTRQPRAVKKILFDEYDPILKPRATKKTIFDESFQYRNQHQQRKIYLMRIFQSFN
jgi:hypothetical protein